MKKLSLNLITKSLLFFLIFPFILTGCDEASGGDLGYSEEGGRATIYNPIITLASGEVTYSNGVTTIDASHTDDGYVMIKYEGDSSKVQVQITGPGGEMYPYPLKIGDFQAFPLTEGNGSYQINVLENVSDNLYSMNFSETIMAQLSDEFRPYLFPNQYVGYTQNSKVVKLGIDISDKSADDIGFLNQVYSYTIQNISYDTEFAQNAPSNYIPTPDATLEKGKGICFDYAAVMSSMLRSQGIPTKLVVGYSGSAYHAWISVYLSEHGWVDNIIEFDGKNWSLMDPTLASSNNSQSVAQYIGDGSNYTSKYFY